MIAPLEVGEYLHRNLPGSTLRVLSATGHCPHMSHPEETIAVMREYLSARRRLTSSCRPRADEPDGRRDRRRRSIDPLLDAAPCGFVSFADDGTIRATNATLLEMLGFTRDELVGRHVETILNVGTRIFYQTHFFPLLRLHGRAEEIFLLLRPKDRRRCRNHLRTPCGGSAAANG